MFPQSWASCALWQRELLSTDRAVVALALPCAGSGDEMSSHGLREDKPHSWGTKARLTLWEWREGQPLRGCPVPGPTLLDHEPGPACWRSRAV